MTGHLYVALSVLVHVDDIDMATAEARRQRADELAADIRQLCEGIDWIIVTGVQPE